ncbi:hypothetical protein HYPSUDRAFT_202041 [Hypholoma sublateritium FD-334 SS-4]|uniref:Uncharacterized protein n=1 Tax=Hypholoma sublateritium (strain FD-334 SS-4) TaxID=945553 RepID=A0A0D2MGJ1_HYPSF|nr:hypothetical protein HYPSUDRAFT_202041 [Hypholoma sublateritium FD-334 SS-4]
MDPRVLRRTHRINLAARRQHIFIYFSTCGRASPAPRSSSTPLHPPPPPIPPRRRLRPTYSRTVHSTARTAYTSHTAHNLSCRASDRPSAPVRPAPPPLR